MSAPGLRVGWCPGALRPMRVGDGLLVRVKPRGNRLTIAQARAVALASRRFGNGVLNLTARGNVQIRGVDEVGLEPLLGVLADAELLDPSVAGEAVRNVQCSPLAGLDPTALLDIDPIVAAWEQRLTSDPLLQRLPPKFAWAIDDGGRYGRAAGAADVTFTAVRQGTETMFAVGLDGATDRALCDAGDLCDVGLRLSAALLNLGERWALAPHRMRDLVAVVGAPAVFAEAGLDRAPEHGNPDLRQPLPIGLTDHCGAGVVAVAPLFGRLEAGALDRAAQAATRWGASMLRLTAARSLVVVGLADRDAGRLVRALASDFIVDPTDPRLAVAACAGQPACLRATRPVQEDAARLVTFLVADGRGGVPLHVSGCAKGCAHSASAALTLVGRDGAYDLVRDGRAGDEATMQGLSVAAVEAMLRAPAPVPIALTSRETVN